MRSGQVDVTAPQDVEVKIRSDGKVVWVNVDGICLFRVCRIQNLTVSDERDSDDSDDDSECLLPDDHLGVCSLKSPEAEFTFQTTLTKRQMWDLVCTGMESGNYGSFMIVGYDQKATKPTFPEEEEHVFRHIDTVFQGGAVLLMPKYEDDEGLSDEALRAVAKRLDRASLQRGLDVLNEKHPGIMARIVSENYDAIDGDAFIQCCVLGEVVYG